MIEAGFVILMTFLADTHSGARSKLWCTNQTCVDYVIDEAKGSTTLRRLRVFKAAEFGGTMPLGGTTFPPLLDISYD